jgi:ParB/RepB/Spo0J family partition protein
MTIELINLKFIDDNPYQDREVYNDIEGLARIIAIEGLKQTPKARKSGNRYQLEFGHRRKRSFEWLRENCKKEGLPERYSGYTAMPLDVEELTDKQMFDGVVIENVHRDDLKVTEKARLLKRYKELNPEATSTAIGLVFNMNAATVRGMDIFLDLPKPVQDKLDDGTISMGTARTLHSMQRIAPEAVVVATVNEIEKSKGKRLPESVIENKIEHLSNTVEMWDESNRDGKPRSSWQNGWLLDMKNFPNKQLPELTKEEAALEADKREHLINPPACTACPFYTKVRGSHYCGMKACHTRKKQAWYAHTLQQASKDLGIAIYETSDGAFTLLDSYDDRKLFDSRHKGLRLVPTARVNGNHYQHFPSIDDDIALIVATGDAIAKLNRRGGGKQTRGGKMTDREKAERRAMKIYRTRRLELMWEYTAAVKTMFDSVPLNVLTNINRWENILIDDTIPEKYKHGNADGDYQRRALVWRLIKQDCSHYHRQAMTTILNAMQKRTGVKPPKALLKQAEQWDAEINAAAKPVAVETGKEK